MAKASAKKTALANRAGLDQLHRVSAAIFLGGLVLLIVRRRSYVPFIILSIPAAFIEYMLEQSCKPVFQDNNLVRTGQDFNQSGLTEYMRDIVYLSWVSAILSLLIGNKAWHLLWLIPGFAGYKCWGLLKSGKQLLFGSGAKPRARQDSKASTPSRGAAQASSEQLSKRQEKRQKLMNKRQSQLTQEQRAQIERLEKQKQEQKRG